MSLHDGLLSFQIKETVFLPPDQAGISDVNELELLPDVEILQNDQELSITGCLRLQGSYEPARLSREDAAGDDDSLVSAVQFTPFAVDGNEPEPVIPLPPENGFSHRIPLNITVPRSRIAEIGDVFAVVDHFDYELKGPRELVIQGVLKILGIRLDDEVDQKKQKDVWEFVHVANDPSEDEYTPASLDDLEQRLAELEREVAQQYGRNSDTPPFPYAATDTHSGFEQPGYGYPHTLSGYGDPNATPGYDDIPAFGSQDAAHGYGYPVPHDPFQETMPLAFHRPAPNHDPDPAVAYEEQQAPQIHPAAEPFEPSASAAAAPRPADTKGAHEAGPADTKGAYEAWPAVTKGAHEPEAADTRDAYEPGPAGGQGATQAEDSPALRAEKYRAEAEVVAQPASNVIDFQAALDERTSEQTDAAVDEASLETSGEAEPDETVAGVMGGGEEAAEDADVRVAISSKPTEERQEPLHLSSLFANAGRVWAGLTEKQTESSSSANAMARPADDEEADRQGRAVMNTLTSFAGSEEQPFARLKMCIAQRDDTLEKIAERYDLPPSRLKEVNQLSSDQLEEGQVLYIPL